MSNKGKQINVAQIERDQEMKNARAFRNSIRGKFIISQALTIGIKHLKKLEKRKDMYPKYGEHAQPSNRADMEYLKRQLYPIYDVVPRSREALHEWGIVNERKSDGEPTTADEYNEEYINQVPIDAYTSKTDYYDDNNEEYIK